MENTVRHIHRAAISELIANVRSLRAQMAAGDPDRQFYLGVEAAAEQWLKPEMASTRTSAWLERQEPGFREGYEQALTTIAVSAIEPEPPLRLRVPEPDRHSSGSPS